MTSMLGERHHADLGAAFLQWATRTSNSPAVPAVLKEYAANVGTPLDPAENRRLPREEGDPEGLERLADLALDLMPTALDESRVITVSKV